MTTGGPTPRHLLVLLLCAQGYSAQQVATMLGTTPERAEELLCEATRAMGTEDWREAAREARRRGLI